MVLQLKGLQLMDKREGMQETSTPASVRRALPSSKEEDEEEAEEDESEDEDGERKKTKKKKGKKHAKPQVSAVWLMCRVDTPEGYGVFTLIQ
eukprot:3756132-Rhodomonas_salina.1